MALIVGPEWMKQEIGSWREFFSSGGAAPTGGLPSPGGSSSDHPVGARERFRRLVSWHRAATPDDAQLRKMRATAYLSTGRQWVASPLHHEAASPGPGRPCFELWFDRRSIPPIIHGRTGLSGWVWASDPAAFVGAAPTPASDL